MRGGNLGRQRWYAELQTAEHRVELRGRLRSVRSLVQRSEPRRDDSRLCRWQRARRSGGIRQCGWRIVRIAAAAGAAALEQPRDAGNR